MPAPIAKDFLDAARRRTRVYCTALSILFAFAGGARNPGAVFATPVLAVAVFARRTAVLRRFRSTEAQVVRVRILASPTWGIDAKPVCTLFLDGKELPVRIKFGIWSNPFYSGPVLHVETVRRHHTVLTRDGKFFHLRE